MTTSQFTEKRAALILYLKLKISEGDWHAVSDAANDLRVFEAQWCEQRLLLPYKNAYEALYRTVNPPMKARE